MTKYLRDKKTHKAINNQYFKRLNIVAKELYEVEFLKSTIEHRELFIVGFFILQYAKLRMLELCYNFFDKFCDVNNFEELEKDNGYRFPLFGLGRRRFRCLHPLAEEDLETANEARTVETTSEQMQKKNNFFSVLAVLNIRHMTRENQDYSRRSSDAPKSYACVVKPIAVTIVKVKSIS